MPITEEQANEIAEAGLKSIEVIAKLGDPLVLNSIMEDRAGYAAASKEITPSHEAALLRIYQRLRPGNPPQLEKATDLFREKFFDVNRYRLGRVGRFRINRKFTQDIPDSEMTLRAGGLRQRHPLSGPAAQRRPGRPGRRHRQPGKSPPADDR